MPSYYEALPIFRAAMDAAVRVDRAVQRFPKGHKYALGTKLRDASADIIVLVARANRRAGRAQSLAALCDRVEELKLLLQLGKEVRAFQSFREFAEVMEQVVALARQAEAWRRATTSASNTTRPEPERSAPRGQP
jgi:23S rRNA-intervening sequence protein